VESAADAPLFEPDYGGESDLLELTAFVPKLASKTWFSTTNAQAISTWAFEFKMAPPVVRTHGEGEGE